MAYILAIILIVLLILSWFSIFLGIFSPPHIGVILLLSAIIVIIIFAILFFEKIKNKEDRYYDDNVHK